MDEIDDVTRSHLPSVRIWLCGPFQLDWLDSTTGNTSSFLAQDLQGRDSTQALSLLKLLLCQPERQAHRDWIMEQFWPEHSRSVATHRLENVFSSLRKLLLPPSGGESLLHSTRGKKNSGVLYSLPAYPRMWVDSDAITWNVEQAARMERFGDDSLSFWQRAFDLLKRGPLLTDEPYASWVKERRELLDGYTRQCVHALAHLYLTHYGEASKAEAVLLLRTYWQQHKTDEDALRPLLELLGEQERYQEAEEYYQQLLLAFTDLDTTEDEKPREPDARTRDIRDYLSVKQIRRALKKEELFPLISPSNHASSAQKQKLFVSFTDTEAPGNDALAFQPSYTQQVPYVETILSDLATQLISGVVPPSTRTIGIEQYKNQIDAGRGAIQTRRQILHHLLMIGSTALVLSPYAMLYPKGSALLNPSVLEELETITASYWRLCANTSLDLLGNLSEHFRTIVNLLQRTLPHTTAQRLCSLSGETAQILGKTLFDMQEYTLAWSYYMFSLKAAQAASNHDLWAAGIGRLILLLIYWEHPQNALPLLEEVHQLTLQNTRITCWLAVVEAEVHAHLGDAESCDTALKTAKEISKNEPLGEDWYATGFSASRLAGYEGACFVRLHQPGRALAALQQALSLLDPQAIRRQSTLLTDMGIAYAQQGNIQKACQFASQALSLTKQTKSRSVLERIRLVRSELEAWRELNEVQELEKHIDHTLTLITA